MRKLLGVGGVLLAVVGVFAAGRLWSQDKMPPARPETRVGLLNLTAVVTNYDKYKEYKEQMKAAAKPYEERIKAKQAEIETLRKESTDTANPPAEARRQDIEVQMKAAQHEIEAANDEAKTRLGAEAQKQMVEIYKAVQDASGRYAKAHGLEIVFQYNEPIEKDSSSSSANVERKMGAAALIPLYMAPGVDITDDLTTFLNESK